MLIFVACLFVRLVCRLNEKNDAFEKKAYRMDMNNGIGWSPRWLCATVLKKSAACLIAAIMNGVNFYRKSDSLRQKKAKRKGSAA